MRTLTVSDTRYSREDVYSLVGAQAIRFEKTGAGVVYTFQDDVTVEAIEMAEQTILLGQGVYEFRGVRVRSSVDVDNVVSAHIKDAIAPGRPANLQSEAEKALLAKISALTAKKSLGLALSEDEQAYLEEKLTFYTSTVQVIRDEGNAFIAARDW